MVLVTLLHASSQSHIATGDAYEKKSVCLDQWCTPKANLPLIPHAKGSRQSKPELPQI